MRKFIVFLAAIIIAASGFAQNKKELAERINAQDEKISLLESSIKELQSSASSLQTNIKNLSETINLLEKKLKFQEDIINNQNSTIQQLQKDLASVKSASVAANPNAIISDPQNEEDSIIQLIQLYFSAKKWEDRIPLVYKPEEAQKMMPKAYAEGITRYEVNKNKISIPGDNYKAGDKFIAKWDGSPIYIIKTPEGFKIDWIATSGYDEVPLRNYNDLKMTEKNIVHAEFRTMEDDGKSDLGNKYYTIFIDNTFVRLQKNSAAGQRLSQIVKNSNDDIRIIVEVQGKRMMNGYGDYEYYVLINRIVRENWFSE
ncbi:MAG: hypothetical protein K6D59_11400 [Bacteroidales bacterium]|nr:hypothetical protein [Bacteroidales bacterium]